jgi:hypothetical protein
MTDVTVLDRFVSWTLDHDGDIYGDERERLRWYEGIAIAATVQWVVVPWAIAIMSWIADRQTAMYLLILAVVFYVPIFLTTAHVVRKHVNTTPLTWTKKRVITTVASGLPFLVMVVGLTRALDEGLDPGGVVGGAIGGGVGLVVAIFATRAISRRRAAAEADRLEE